MNKINGIVKDVSELGNILNKCKPLLLINQTFYISYIRRQTNGVTHVPVTPFSSLQLFQRIPIYIASLVIIEIYISLFLKKEKKKEQPGHFSQLLVRKREVAYPTLFTTQNFNTQNNKRNQLSKMDPYGNIFIQKISPLKTFHTIVPLSSQLYLYKKNIKFV